MLPWLRGNRLAVALALVFGVLTVVLVRAYVQQRERELRRELLRGQEPVPVLVAVEDIPKGTTIDEDHVSVEARPAYAIQPHALQQVAAAYGLVAVIPLYKGEQLTDAKLARPGATEALSLKTPPGKRAVTIGADALGGAGGMVKPGDFVDVIGIFALPGAEGQTTSVTVTLLQRIEVLAVGGRLSAVDEGASTAGGDNTLTLALTPEEAQLVLFAQSARAELQLVLRSQADTAPVAGLAPTTQETLLGFILGPEALEAAKQQALAVPLQPRTRTVEVIRGREREQVSVPEDAPAR